MGGLGGRDGRTLVGLLVGAIALRPQLVGIAPLLPAIQDDLGVSHAVAGLLTALPVLCLGLTAPLAAALAARVGSRAAVAGCLGGIAVLGVARAVTPSVPALLVLTIGVGVMMGLATSVMPVAVKERAAHRPGLATGAYATGINLGSTAAAAVAVPIAQAIWGWRAALLWLGALDRRPHVRPDAPLLPRLPLRSRLVWLLVVVFGLLGTVYHGLATWLPDAVVERGWTEGEAGVLAAVFNASLLPAGLLVGWLADRTGGRRWLLVSSAAIMLLGTLLVALSESLVWPGAVLVGFGDGAFFALFMTLPLDMGRSPAQVGGVVALVLGIGYAISAVNPFLLGAIRDATGGFDVPFWVVAAAAAAILALVPLLTRERLRRALPP